MVKQSQGVIAPVVLERQTGGYGYLQMLVYNKERSKKRWVCDVMIAGPRVQASDSETGDERSAWCAMRNHDSSCLPGKAVFDCDARFRFGSRITSASLCARHVLLASPLLSAQNLRNPMHFQCSFLNPIHRLLLYASHRTTETQKSQTSSVACLSAHTR